MTDYVEELETEISRLAAAENQNFSLLLNLSEALKKSNKLTVDITRSSGLTIIAGHDTFIASVLMGGAGFSLKGPRGMDEKTFVQFSALWETLRRAMAASLHKQFVEGMRE